MKKARRKATYPAALRMASIVWMLWENPYGMSFAAIERDLRISNRTLLRYVAALKKMGAFAGRPMVEAVRRGAKRYLKIPESPRPFDSGRYRAASLYFMIAQLKFFEGTVMREGAEDLWRRTMAALSPADQQMLADFDRKFYSVPYAPKDYREFDDQIDAILKGIVGQKRLRIEYAGMGGEIKEHLFDPYTLAAHHGGLYAIGLSDRGKKILTLAVERIRKAEAIRGRDNNEVRFPYPKSYSPEKYLDGTFGLMEGPETRVELRLLESTEAYLRPRMIHPTQKFIRRGGHTILTMRVRGTTELRNFILSHGPWIEVLKPASLREEIAGLFAEGARLYGR
ncbi:MAG: helix-turn-helix transcriptional regulator [Candidatus Binataceae bacterium]